MNETGLLKLRNQISGSAMFKGFADNLPLQLIHGRHPANRECTDRYQSCFLFLSKIGFDDDRSMGFTGEDSDNVVDKCFHDDAPCMSVLLCCRVVNIYSTYQ